MRPPVKLCTSRMTVVNARSLGPVQPNENALGAQPTRVGVRRPRRLVARRVEPALLPLGALSHPYSKTGVRASTAPLWKPGTVTRSVQCQGGNSAAVSCKHLTSDAVRTVVRLFLCHHNPTCLYKRHSIVAPVGWNASRSGLGQEGGPTLLLRVGFKASRIGPGAPAWVESDRIQLL